MQPHAPSALRVSSPAPRQGGWWLLACLLMVLMFAAPLQVRAQQDSYTRITGVKLEPVKNGAQAGWNLAAELDIHLGQRLKDALDRGLPLKFSLDFKLSKDRWYWADEEAANASYLYTLSYNALTRTYQLAGPAGVLNTPKFEEAMENMARIRDWPVLRKDQVRLNERYQAQVRFRLVLTELPKPFQISALVNSEWDLSTDWLTFDFTPRKENFK